MAKHPCWKDDDREEGTLTRVAVRELRKACRCLYIAVDKVIADDVSRHAEAVIALLPATPASSDVLTEQADGMVRRLEGALRELEQLVKRDAKSDAQQVMDHTITSFVELRDHLRAPVPPSSSIAASETATTAQDDAIERIVATLEGRPTVADNAKPLTRRITHAIAMLRALPRSSSEPAVTTDAETATLPGWCLYCGGTYRTVAPGIAGCESRDCVRHPYINEANAAKKAAAWRGAPESSPAVPLCSQCGKHDARFACPDFLSSPAVDAGTTDAPLPKPMYFDGAWQCAGCDKRGATIEGIPHAAGCRYVLPWTPRYAVKEYGREWRLIDHSIPQSPEAPIAYFLNPSEAKRFAAWLGQRSPAVDDETPEATREAHETLNRIVEIAVAALRNDPAYSPNRELWVTTVESHATILRDHLAARRSPESAPEANNA